MARRRLIYLPLGGAGEIGMNMYCYGWGAPGRERFILVDVGVTFPSMDGTPGVDLIMADPAWIEERRDRLEAIFITHAHEDHVGALGILHERLGRPPIHARPFTGRHAARKLEERGGDPRAVRIAEPWPATVKAGPFEVGFLPISHSIPEASSLVIDTPAGRLIHTGDFKLDRTPVVGEPFDPELWAEVARGRDGAGVLALVCDSTNVFSPHPGRSEAVLADPIAELVAEAPGMVVATTFASNVARLRTLAEAGRRAGRAVVLLGRAMRQMLQTAIETGVVSDFPRVLSPDEAADVPREHLMLLATGSQGERRAATAQLSQGKHYGFTLSEGDLFLFSSKTIPGNEIAVARVMNRLSEMGVDIVDGEDGRYHVSGHANRPDLAELHRLVQPKLVIPMHGEHRHLREHVKLAREGGFGAALAPNGTMLDLTSGTAEVAAHVETGRVYLDGSALFGAFDGIVLDRIRMAINGHVAVAVVIDEADLPIDDAWVMIQGLAPKGRTGRALEEEVSEAVMTELARAKPRVLRDDDALEREITRVVRRVVEAEIGKRPEVSVLISRLTLA